MSNILLPKVMAVVHPIDEVKHPTWGRGFRWAIQVGGSAPNNLALCANAGMAPDYESALVMADRCGATLTAGLMMLGFPASFEILRLDSDPLESDDDQVHVLPVKTHH